MQFANALLIHNLLYILNLLKLPMVTSWKTPNMGIERVSKERERERKKK